MNDDGASTAPDQQLTEQLNELQLLTRVDHSSPLSGRSPASSPEIGRENGCIGEPEHDDDEGGDEDIRIETPGSASFTALLAASRRLATGNAPAGPMSPPPPSVSSVVPAISSSATPEATRAQAGRRTMLLPTLSEEDDGEDAAMEIDVDARGPAVDEDDADDDLTHVTSSHASSGGSSKEYVAPPCEDRPQQEDEDDDCMTTWNMGDGSGDADADANPPPPVDPALLSMLRELRYDPCLLALPVADVSLRNIHHVRVALSDALKLGAGDTTTTATERMRGLRTLLAVDTLRLLLARFEEEHVRLTLMLAVRRIFERYVQDHGVAPLAHAPGVLTHGNITRAVLWSRAALMQPSSSSMTTDNNPHEGPRVVSRGTSPFPSPSSRTPHSSWRSRPSPISGASASSSPLSRAASSPSTKDSPQLRRSILASDGAHVLMSERLAAFQHRDPGAQRLPSFRVRRDSAVVVEEAAYRRQRCRQYGEEIRMATFPS